MASQLILRYSTMGAGKSTNLLQVDFNYREQKLNTLMIKPKFDTRDGDYISSRLGVKRKVDYLVSRKEDIFALVEIDNLMRGIDCVLIDEANFLTKEQARQLWRVAVDLDILVIAYGLRVDYRGEGFEGTKELMTLAHKIEELKTVDSTGKKCTMHLRSVDGQYTFEGDSLIVGDVKGDIKYEACTSTKWLSEYNKSQRAKVINQIDHRGGMC